MRIRFDNFVLDTERKELIRGREPVRLSPRAFRLLSYLAAARPRAVSKRDLLDHIWAGNVVEEANLKTLVLEIRKALNDRGAVADAIRTVYGYGYAFAGEAVEESAPASEQRVRVEVQQRVILLPVGIHEIGRSSSCAVFIDAASVSRVHALLHVGPETLLLEDNSSKNGTFVSGKRLAAPTALPFAARVRCGDVELLITRIAGELADTATVDEPVRSV
jgi:DNA-binding winged helix-turn-helix (wHTH) protein